MFNKKISIVSLPSGEKSKSFKYLELLCEKILEKKIDRKTLLVCIGGGVIGDLVGLTASILLRGIDFVQISQSGQLILQDAGEISNLTAQKLSLSISLSDSRGKTKTITGIVMVDNALVMESIPTFVNSWMNSSWLGNFHKTGGPWIFHEKLYLNFRL